VPDETLKTAAALWQVGPGRAEIREEKLAPLILTTSACCMAQAGCMQSNTTDTGYWSIPATRGAAFHANLTNYSKRTLQWRNTGLMYRSKCLL